MNSRKKLIALIVLIIFVFLGFVLVQPSKESRKNMITIGAAIALTGDGASWGEMSLKGAEMAVDEINTDGGIHGKQLRLVVEDTQSTSIGSTSAVQKLVNADHAFAVIGPTWLDVYQGAQGVVDNSSIPLISVDAGAEAINSPKPYSNVFSLWYRSQPKAELLMRYLSSMGVRTLAIVHQNDAYYQDFGNRLEALARDLGIIIVRREAVNGGEEDFRTLLIKLKQDRPDMVFVGLYDQKSSGGFLRNRAQIAPDLLIASDELGQDYVDSDEYRRFIDGMLFFSAVIQDQSFERRFRARYDNLNPKFGAPNGYDAIKILSKALGQQSNNAVEYLKQSFFNTATFGEMKFDELNGVKTNSQMFVMKQLKNGKVSVIE